MNIKEYQNLKSYQYIPYVLLLNIIIVFIFFFLIPISNEYTTLSEYKESLEQEADKEAFICGKISQSKKQLKSLIEEWEQISLEKSSVLNISENGNFQNIDKWRLVQNVRIWRDKMQRNINKNFQAQNITIIKGPMIPEVPVNPDELLEKYLNYPAIPFPVSYFECKDNIVEGKYHEIIAYLHKWNCVKGYSAYLNNVNLENYNGNVRATFDLNMLFYLNVNPNANKIEVKN